MNKPIIHLEDIEPRKIGKFENLYIELEKDTKKKLLEIAINISPEKSLHSLSKLINVKSATLWACVHRGSIPISILRKLSKVLIFHNYQEFSLKNLEKSINFIKGAGHKTKLTKPKFPLRFNTPEGVRILSKIFHDGGIKSNRQPFYTNSNYDLVNEFREDVIKLFGDMNLQIRPQNSILIIRLPHFISNILEIAGASKGPKVLNNAMPPSWILELDKNLIREYLRVAYDDEGCVGDRQIAMNSAIDITNKIPQKLFEKLIQMNLKERTLFLRTYFNYNLVPNILIFNKKLLEIFDIKTSDFKLEKCYADKNNQNLRTIWHISITSKENLQKFSEQIGFKLKYKIKNLQEYLDNTKFIAKDGEKLLNVLQVARNLEVTQQYFTFFNLAKSLNYWVSWIGKIVREGEQKGFVKRIGRDTNRRIKFILTNQGNIYVNSKVQ